MIPAETYVEGLTYTLNTTEVSLQQRCTGSMETFLRIVPLENSAARPFAVPSSN